MTISDSVTNIGVEAFYACAGLTGVTMGNNVARIGEWAFWSCSSLTSITIPKSVGWVGGVAFPFCTSLTDVYFKGDAPVDTGAVFDYDNNATVYYLPGTKSWASTFSGRPTALWLPQVSTTDPSFGVRTNQFGFNIAWASGMRVVVEAATNLTTPNWLPLQTNLLSGDSQYFSNPGWTNYPTRFYRIRSPWATAKTAAAT